MIRQSLLILAVASLAGCSTNATFDPSIVGGDKQEAAQLAAFAATAKFPTTAPASSDLKVAAFTHGDDVKLVNFSSDAIAEASVWVNGIYVHKITVLPANGTVAIPAGQFYDRGGRVLNNDKTPITKVQIEAGNQVWNTLGPVVQQ